MSYTHITSFQRNEVSALLRAEIKQKDIAKLLGKTPSAICQELKRSPANTKTGYDAGIAKKNVTERRIIANARFRKIDNDIWLKKYIEDKISLYWPSEQISGRLKIDCPEKGIGKDSIYKYIYNERKDLVKHLCCQKGKYRRRYGTRIRMKQREEMKKKRIDQRPEIGDTRERLLRQFFPKKSSFAMITQEEIEIATDLINNRPRKRLNYKTPVEMFY